MHSRLAPLALVALLSSVTVAQIPDTRDPAVAKKLRAELTKAEANYKKAKAAHTQKPKDTKLRKAYIDATVNFGTVTMNSPLLAPKEKYPRALRLYNEALKLDPKNKEATNNKQLIEQIYKQMGKPVPKG